MTSALVVFSAVLGIALLAAGIVQINAGVVNIGQFVAFTVSFAILTLFAIWFTIAILCKFEEN